MIKADLNNKKVFLRVDFNVPLENKKILDDTKILEAIPTIKYLIKEKAKQIIICTHLGRPRGKDPKFSTKILINLLSEKLGLGITHFELAEKDNPPQDELLILLENIRFYDGEESCSPEFSKRLSSLADRYINDGFSIMHRKHASVVGITKYLPSFIGNSASKEISIIRKFLNPKKNSIAIIGGSKLETKLPIIKNLSKKYDKVLLGSLIGLELSRVYKGPLFKNIIAPKDFIIQVDGEIKSINLNENLTKESIKDIGPRTIKEYENYVNSAQTIIWNGPLGECEDERFSKGTDSIIKAIAKSKAKKLAGGGETLLAIKKMKLEKEFTHLSTGGGALLEMLAGKELPGIKAITI